MKVTVDRPMFIDAFQDSRPDSFSYAALGALFDHLDNEDNGDTEFDVIAIDSTYAEYDIEDLPGNYGIFDDEVTDDWDVDDFVNFLSDHTTAFDVNDDTVIVQEF